jgi:Na+/glutamate symporter
LSSRFAHRKSDRMSKRTSRNLPAMMTQLTLSSWETIFHRSMMMAQGTCSVAEYQRMVMEKTAAMQASTLAMMTGRGNAAALAPYLVRSRANARRLRRK